MRTTEVRQAICDGLLGSLKDKYPKRSLSQISGRVYNEEGSNDVIFIVLDQIHIYIFDKYVEVTACKNPQNQLSVKLPDDIAICQISLISEPRNWRCELEDPLCFDKVFQEIESILE